MKLPRDPFQSDPLLIGDSLKLRKGQAKNLAMDADGNLVDVRSGEVLDPEHVCSSDLEEPIRELRF